MTYKLLELSELPPLVGSKVSSCPTHDSSVPRATEVRGGRCFRSLTFHVYAMASNELTGDERKKLLEQIYCEIVSSDEDDDVDFIISVEDNDQENEYTSAEPHHELLHEEPFVLDDTRAVRTSLTETPKLFSQKRKVCSIDTALNPENYKAFQLPDTEQTYNVKISKKTKHEPEKTLIWSNIPPVERRTAAENIIQARPTVKPEVSSAVSHLSAWNVFFSNDMITAIVDSTNKKNSTKSHSSTKQGGILLHKMH